MITVVSETLNRLVDAAVGDSIGGNAEKEDNTGTGGVADVENCWVSEGNGGGKGRGTDLNLVSDSRRVELGVGSDFAVDFDSSVECSALSLPLTLSLSFLISSLVSFIAL